MTHSLQRCTHIEKRNKNVNINTSNSFVLHQRAQSFIRSQYAHCHGADIECDYPILLSVVNEDKKMLAAVGIRFPQQVFFLEQYLQLSIEQALSQHYGESIERSKIVEVGNLAGGKDIRATNMLMHCVWRYLINKGYNYLAMTATRSLLCKFRQLPLVELACAHAESIPDSTRWGKYYDKQPRVVAGCLHDYDARFIVNGEGLPLRAHVTSYRGSA